MNSNNRVSHTHPAHAGGAPCFLHAALTQLVNAWWGSRPSATSDTAYAVADHAPRRPMTVDELEDWQVND